MIRKENNQFIIYCDDCSNFRELGTADFLEAVRLAADKGWKRTREGAEYRDHCGCQISGDQSELCLKK